MTVGRSEGWLDGLKRRLLEMKRDSRRATSTPPMAPRVVYRPPGYTKPTPDAAQQRFGGAQPSSSRPAQRPPTPIQPTFRPAQRPGLAQPPLSPSAKRLPLPQAPVPRPAPLHPFLAHWMPAPDPRPNQLVDQGRSKGTGETASARVHDIELIPDDTPVAVPGAASERQQLEIETHRRRVLKNQTPINTTHEQGGIRHSLDKSHPIQWVGDATLDHLHGHVQPYIDSD